MTVQLQCKGDLTNDSASQPEGVHIITMCWTGGNGLCTWLERWDLPSCWMALSADQGSSMVRCTRLCWLAAAAEACREDAGAGRV